MSESDSILLVNALTTMQEKSLFDIIFEDCCELVKHYEEVLVEFVPRSASSVAHEITRAACSSSVLREWYDTAHNFMMCNLLIDGF